MRVSIELGLDLPTPLGGPTAITNVTVVPMTYNGHAAGKTVIVNAGLIETVGPCGEVPTQGMRVIDGSGHYLMPGLADMHVHLWDASELAMYLANGVTTVRNMFGAPFHLAFQELVRSRKLPGPHVIAASPIVDGTDAEGRTSWPGSIPLTNPGEARDLVEELSDRGYQQIKVYEQLSPECLRSLGEAAANAGLLVAGHCPKEMTFEQAIAAGLSCFEHLAGIGRGHLRQGFRHPVHRRRDPYAARNMARSLSHHLDFDAIRRLADQMARRQVWNCPTLTLSRAAARPPSQCRQEPLLRYEPLLTCTAWRWALAAFKDDPSHLSLMLRRHETMLKVVSALHEAGAPLLLGTDSPNPFVIQGFSIHDELEDLAAAGLNPYEALLCGTREAARFVGQSAEWGTIEEGKRADLLLVGRDPLEHVSAVRDLGGLFVNGFFFSRSNLADLLRQRERIVRELGNVAERVPALWEEEADATAGLFVERIHGVMTGKLRFSHRPLPDGSWLVREAYQGAPWRVRQSTSLGLDRDFTLLAGRCLTETPIGDQTCEFQLSNDGNYVVHVRDVDGHETVYSLPEGRLLPSERLCPSLLPLILPSLISSAPSWVQTLSIDDGRARLVAMRADPPEEAELGQKVHRVTVARPGEPSQLTYRFSQDGCFLSMTESGHRVRDRHLAPPLARRRV